MLRNSSSTKPCEISRYSYPHLVHAIRGLEGKGSLHPLSSTDGKKQVFRAGNTKMLTTDTPPASTLPPSHKPSKTSVQEQKGNGILPSACRAAPAIGDLDCSLGGEASRSQGGNDWTSALGGKLHSRLKQGQDLCFPESSASALLLPSFLKYNFLSYKYLSRAEEPRRTARWWQR